MQIYRNGGIKPKASRNNSTLIFIDFIKIIVYFSIWKI